MDANLVPGVEGPDVSRGVSNFDNSTKIEKKPSGTEKSNFEQVFLDANTKTRTNAAAEERFRASNKEERSTIPLNELHRFKSWFELASTDELYKKIISASHESLLKQIAKERADEHLSHIWDHLKDNFSHLLSKLKNHL